MKGGKELKALQVKLGYTFSDPSLLQTALTHSSYVNEHRREKLSSNERLEFLGDAVVDLSAAEYLYRSLPEDAEGSLSRRRAGMVSEKPLAKCARDLGIDKVLRLGKGEELSGGRKKDSLISDAMEAVIGAVFLDGGAEAAIETAKRCILLDLGEKDLFEDQKTPLQEQLQAMGRTISWKLLSETGPDHAKVFRVAALSDGEIIGVGEGQTKKAAAQAASADAMAKLSEDREGGHA